MDVPLQGTDQDDDGEAPAAKKRKPFKATQKAMAEMRSRGWTCAVTEKWNPHARIRQDLFGFVDLIALRPGATAGEPRTLAVQVTTTDTSTRQKKITGLPAALVWLQCANAIEVWGYKKKSGGVRGGRKLWTLVRTRARIDYGATPGLAIVWDPVAE